MMKERTRAGNARAGVVMNRQLINEKAFQEMADSTKPEMMKIVNGIAKDIRKIAPVGSRREHKVTRVKGGISEGVMRSKNSIKYGPIKGPKTKGVSAGRRVKKWKDGKRDWSFVTERVAIRTPFYAYMIDKGWNAASGPRQQVEKGKGFRARKRAQKWQRAAEGKARFVKGTGFITDTIRKRAAA
jgi:hypothetical protein